MKSRKLRKKRCEQTPIETLEQKLKEAEDALKKKQEELAEAKERQMRIRQELSMSHERLRLLNSIIRKIVEREEIPCKK